jgi:hypothetical protein
MGSFFSNECEGVDVAEVAFKEGDAIDDDSDDVNDDEPEEEEEEAEEEVVDTDTGER